MIVTRLNMWCEVKLSVCSINVNTDSPRVHASVMKGRRLKFPPHYFSCAYRYCKIDDLYNEPIQY